MGFVSSSKLSFDDAVYVQRVRSYIDHHPNSEAIDIARSLGISLAIVDRVLDSLVKSGYIVETDS